MILLNPKNSSHIILERLPSGEIQETFLSKCSSEKRLTLVPESLLEEKLASYDRDGYTVIG